MQRGVRGCEGYERRTILGQGDRSHAVTGVIPGLPRKMQMSVVYTEIRPGRVRHDWHRRIKTEFSNIRRPRCLFARPCRCIYGSRCVGRLILPYLLRMGDSLTILCAISAMKGLRCKHNVSISSNLATSALVDERLRIQIRSAEIWAPRCQRSKLNQDTIGNLVGAIP